MNRFRKRTEHSESSVSISQLPNRPDSWKASTAAAEAAVRLAFNVRSVRQFLQTSSVRPRHTRCVTSPRTLRSLFADNNDVFAASL